MSLPNEEVMDLLRDKFIVGTRNIEREGHVGLSHGYRPNQTAVGTTNGAGGRNVQLLVLAADETVVHALPGFWHAKDLLAELRLALEVHKLHGDDTMPQASKLAMFAALHRSHLGRHEEEMRPRSGWQGFDRSHELMLAKNGPRDTVVVNADGSWRLKSIPEIVHDRLLARPFKKLAAFGMEAFVDYGRPYYDNNMGLDKGKSFPRAEQANDKRERQQAKERKQDERAGDGAGKDKKDKPVANAGS